MICKIAQNFHRFVYPPKPIRKEKIRAERNESSTFQVPKKNRTSRQNSLISIRQPNHSKLTNALITALSQHETSVALELNSPKSSTTLLYRSKIMHLSKTQLQEASRVSQHQPPLHSRSKTATRTRTAKKAQSRKTQSKTSNRSIYFRNLKPGRKKKKKKANAGREEGRRSKER
ncbi:hypothetical protein M758_10G180600 [Ceratodon purpureus]|nr:hypothetical protein M758_10G180600 [Ceratodon purpureus]